MKFLPVFLSLFTKKSDRPGKYGRSGWEQGKLITEVCKKTDAPCRSVRRQRGMKGALLPGETCFYSNGFRDGRKQALRSGLAVPPHMAAPVISGIAVSAIPAVAATISAEITSASLTAEAAGASAASAPAVAAAVRQGVNARFRRELVPEGQAGSAEFGGKIRHFSSELADLFLLYVGIAGKSVQFQPLGLKLSPQGCDFGHMFLNQLVHGGLLFRCQALIGRVVVVTCAVISA